jgi:N-carbamoylputrescine amidase
LLDPQTFGRYRKTHLWDREKVLYEPGRELPVFDTLLGKIGLLVCYDAWFPEAARTLAVKGARILCVSSNAPDDWVPEHQRRGHLTMLDVHCIAANRVGDGYLGRSCVVDVTGGVLALAGETEEGLICADVNPDRARREKRLTDLSHSFEDRNPTVYEGESQEDR